MSYPLLKGGTLSVEDKRDKRLDDHCYYWSTARKSWEDSELYCQHMKGHLAAVTSLDFQNFLKKVNKDEVKTWVSGSDREAEGMWTWADGSAWNFSNWETASQAKEQIRTVSILF